MSKQVPGICWRFISSFPIFLDLIPGYFTSEHMYPSCFLLTIPVVAQLCHPASSCITAMPQQSRFGETKDFRDLRALSVSERWVQSVQHSDCRQIVKGRLSKMLSLLAYSQQRCGKFTDNHYPKICACFDCVTLIVLNCPAHFYAFSHESVVCLHATAFKSHRFDVFFPK